MDHKLELTQQWGKCLGSQVWTLPGPFNSYVAVTLEYNPAGRERYDVYLNDGQGERKMLSNLDDFDDAKEQAEGIMHQELTDYIGLRFKEVLK